MPRKQSLTKKRSGRDEIERLSITVVSFKRDYFISRTGSGEAAFADDEAILEIEGILERAESKAVRHVNHSISVRLVNSKRYKSDETNDCQFFGTATLRGEQRSVLAYLPSEVFWALPHFLEEGASMIEVTVGPMTGGYGELVSLYVGRPQDRPMS